MVHKNVVVFLILTCFNISLAQTNLRFVHVLFRHGDRTPIGPYPSDPYADPSYWPTGFGQLTNRGKEQQYALGKWLRERYNNFLPLRYSLNDIYIQSSNVDRTLMSAEANLAGLYTPVGTDVWKKDLNWMPIPVHTVRKEDDGVIATEKPCPRYKLELKIVLNEDPTIVAAWQEMQPLLKYLSNHTNSNVSNFEQFTRIYDNLFIDEIYNFKLPNWTKDVYPSQMKRWFDLAFKCNSYNLKMKRFTVGLLLNEIMERMENKSNNSLDPDRKMWIYSAHDSNLANLLNTFGVYEECPSYASAIIMELFDNNGTFEVSTFYKNNSGLFPINILGCDLLCPLNKLKKILDPVLMTPKEHDEECYDMPVPVALTVVAIIGISIGALLLIILVSYCCCKNIIRRKRKINP